MRYMIPAFAALVLATSPLAARAQSTPPSPSGTSPSMASPSVTSQGQAVPAPTTLPDTPVPAKKDRLTKLDKRFSAANTTHDGHLTLDQAKAAKWQMVAQNFSKIDADKKGYVTVSDIRIAAQARQAAKAKQSVTQQKS